MKQQIMGLNKLGTICLLICSSFQAVAASEYKKIDPCGSASVVSGDTCSNAKVQFKFAGCEIQSEPQMAKRIICEKHVIKARFQEGAFRYEAQFQKVDDSWGGVSWKPLGGVTQYSKNLPAAKAPALEVKAAVQTADRLPAAAEAPPAPLPSTAVTAASESANSSPFKFGGFADLRYTNFSTKDNPSVTTGNPESGFGLEDGAFYGNYENENLSVVLDVAFRRGKDIDIDLSASKPNQSSTGNFTIGPDKSQLYLKYKVGSNFVVSFGQFDTLFGVELNDSKDRIFGKTGIVYDYTMPTTHTGLMVEFSAHGFYAKSFAANSNNKGSFGSATAGDDKTEYGAALGYSGGMIRGQAGYMTRPINKASSTGVGDRALLDVIVGTTIGGFSLDLEYSQVTDPNKNTLTSTDSNDLENAGYGMLALASYKFTDEFLIGARYEVVKDDPNSLLGSVRTTTAIGGSVHYRLAKELELRTEYTGYDSKAVSGTTWRESRFNVAALLTF